MTGATQINNKTYSVTLVILQGSNDQFLFHPFHIRASEQLHTTTASLRYHRSVTFQMLWQFLSLSLS